MTKFYIQTDKGLIKVGNDITLENIKAALGYIPSDFSGDFYDLNNNPFSNGANGEFNIVDENQNIIAIVDKDGIHSVEMTAIKSGITHNLTEKMNVSEFESIITVDESGKFVVEDENGNEGLKLDSTGLYVKDVTAGKHVLSQKADLDDINFNNLVDNPINIDDKGEFVIEDESGNKGFILNGSGATAKDFTTSNGVSLSNVGNRVNFIQDKVDSINEMISNDEDDRLIIRDGDGEVGLELNKDGLYVKDVTTYDNEGNPKDVLSQKADLDIVNKKLDKSEFAEIITVDETGEFVVEDEKGNVGLKLNSGGLTVINDVIAYIDSDSDVVFHKLSEKADLNDINSLRTDIGETIKDVESKVSKNKEDITNLSTNVNNITERVDIVEDRVDTNESNITNLSNIVNSNKSQINSIQGEVDSINEMISDAEENSFIVSDSNDYIGLKLNQEGLHVNKDVITYTKEGNEEHKLSEKANQSSITEINKTLDDLNSTVKSHTSQIDSISDEVDKKLDKSTFEEVINTETSNTVKVLYDGENVGLTVSASGIYTSGSVSAGEHVLSKKANQSDLEGVDKRLSDIETLLDEDSDDIINNIRDVIDYFKNVSESEVGEAFINSVSENTNNIKKNAEDIKQLSEDVDKLDESVKSVNGIIDGLNNTIEGLDKEVESLNGVVNTNVKNITNLTSTVNTHTSNIKTINDNISLIEDDVDSINEMISDAEENSFIVSDSNDYIGLKLNQEGLHVNKDVITYTKEGNEEHKLSEKANQSDVDAISIITSANASVDSNVGTPSVTVSLTGDDVKNKTLNFEFKNLKGDKGASVASISVVGNLEHGSGKTNTYELTDSEGKKITGEIEVKDGVDGIGIKDITKKDSSDSDSDLVDTYTITYTDDEKEPYDFYVTNGKDGRGITSITKTSTSDLVDTYTIDYTEGDESTFTVTNGKDGYSVYYIDDELDVNIGGLSASDITGYERFPQKGDKIISKNGNVFIIMSVNFGQLIRPLEIKYIYSIKGSDGTSVASVVCVKGDNSENLSDVNNEDGAINYYRIKDNNNNFLEGTIAIKNGSSGSGDSDSDGEFVDIDIPFEEDESGKFVIIDDSADENIGLILDSEGVKSKDFFTSSDVSLNDVGDRVSVVEDFIGIEQITYDNLVQLRNDKLLIPGKKYRITDYVTTTLQANTISAGHQFDIIVTALTKNELSEIASACYHEENYNEDNLENLYISEFNSNLGWNGSGCTFSHSGIRYIDGNIYIEYEDEKNNILIFDFNDKSKVYFDSNDVIKFIPSYYIAPDYGYNDLTENNVSLSGEGFYVPYISTYDNMVGGNETRISLSIREEFNRNYFKNLGCNLSAWKIWYSLDNNSDRFEWADSNGTGVIYRMIDEWGNDCPYDFKNIQFTKTTDDEIITSYTFSFIKEYTLDQSSSTTKGIYKMDTSIAGNNGLLLDDKGNIPGVHNNVIKAYTSGNKQYLNNICFHSSFDYDGYYHMCINNSFGNDCYNNSFGNDCYNNIFGNCCYNNTFGDLCKINIFGSECSDNTFGYIFIGNTFGDMCSGFTFGNESRRNTFGNSCWNITLGDGCWDITLGNDCNSITFGDECYLNKLANGCTNIIFGDVCINNTFNVGCEDFEFGNWCWNNTFGNYCFWFTFGNGCSGNYFVSNCADNTFGNNCSGNMFGNNCGRIFFGDYCSSNTFGTNCDNIIFGNSESTPSSYYRNIIIDNDNRYINLNCTSTTSSSKYYQNVRIGLGVNNTTTIKNIDDSNVGQTYETLYKPANSQTITI